ncbi:MULTISPECIES: hypothetical protein [Cobetia]|uniref:hypothetical protein n=1 Tax=Cobetia TaxID=204286 RepID=UPI001115AAF6|nr:MULTISPECIES: hypothetical protein [Cobetia]
MDKVFVYKERFDELSKHSHDAISMLPALKDDQFAFIVAQNSQGDFGFNKSEDLLAVSSSLLNRARRVDIDDRNLIKFNFFPGSIYIKSKKNDNYLIEELDSYKKVKEKRKKNKLYSKYGKPLIEIEENEITSFFDGDLITKSIFSNLMSHAEYIFFLYTSTEYGRDTFYVCARDLDFFWKDFENSTKEVEVKLVNKYTDVPYT